MIKPPFIIFLPLIPISLFLCGCASSSKIDKSLTERKPRITIQIGSLDLTNLNKRIEQKHIVELAKILKHEQVEVLTVQGISRYPGVAARVDLVDELSRQTDWRNEFGEMLNISGRQTGNVVFSAYPITSHQTIAFEKIISRSFETSLETIIDAGAYPLNVISTQLPAKATAEERLQCVKLITTLNADRTDPPIIITGNLPPLETVDRTSLFTEAHNLKLAKTTVPKIWYTANASFQLLSSRTVETELGTILIAQFGLY
jgi:endonuclease/exonuclease/phosphatase family metal-dependent hydrolase